MPGPESLTSGYVIPVLEKYGRAVSKERTLQWIGRSTQVQNRHVLASQMMESGQVSSERPRRRLPPAYWCRLASLITAVQREWREASDLCQLAQNSDWKMSRSTVEDRSIILRGPSFFL